jgi:hypothetical protein
MRRAINLSIPAANVRVGDFITSIDYDYMARVTRVELLPSGSVEIHMGRNKVVVVAPTKDVGVRR